MAAVGGKRLVTVDFGEHEDKIRQVMIAVRTKYVFIFSLFSGKIM